MATKKPAKKSAASPLVKKPYYGKGSLVYSLEHGEPVGRVMGGAAKSKVARRAEEMGKHGGVKKPTHVKKPASRKK